ncbi:hypothetical protein ACFE04_020194 [Oxalis oulophora]
MPTKIKGIFKGIKFIKQYFKGCCVVVKDKEIQIGTPTDVKHVAHIGLDCPPGTTPSWMAEFKTAPDFSATSLCTSGDSNSLWSSIDFDHSMGRQSLSSIFKDTPTNCSHNAPKKNQESTSSSSSSSTSSGTTR